VDQEMTITIKDCQEDGIYINLDLTKKCNFECAHCGMSAGPTVRSGYMTHEVLQEVRRMVGWCNEREIRVTLNLIGGEPTLNLTEFARVLRELDDLDVTFEMTTNGWWIARKHTLLRFMDIIRPYIKGDCFDNGFSVRISDDQYHRWERQKRGETYMEKSLLANIHDLWDNFYEYIEENDYYRLPERPHDECGWIYVEKDFDKPVVPIGRGADCNSRADKCDHNHHFKLTFEPHGELTDICCKFSVCRFGTVSDNPLYLLNLADKFLRERSPDCWNCLEAAEEWKKDRLEQAWLEVQTEVQLELDQPDPQEDPDL
jgi:hypothetical protein